MDIVYRGKIKDINTGNNEIDFAYGDLIRDLETGRYFICNLSHFNDTTLLKDVLIEVEKDTVELYDKNDI